ncbi:AT-rich interactive domain-containing protein 6-like [Senna tora]|uniref:AT-rich interactive domain-containing protein 6-like n=1 Tax=Senna tora TaxID=362788 RepID=A0A834W4Y0_9FABA|nr:AT-rich interactive domain-containing protein 6-like [Senna tora]
MSARATVKLKAVCKGKSDSAASSQKLKNGCVMVQFLVVLSHAWLKLEMSDTKDKEEPSRDMPLAVNESQQLVDGQGQPQASSDPVPIEETVNHVDIGKVAALIDVKNEKPEAISEDAPQQEVQDIPVEVNAQILVKTDSEHTSDVKTEVEESQRNTGNESGANACENHTNAEIIVEVKPEACNMLNGKNKGDSEITSHTEPTTPPAVPVDTKAEMKNGVENKDNEKQATASADNGNSNSKHLIIWDADHSYNGNVSGTEEDQSAFMKELENFFRERSMEFKPPKFYGEGLNCLKLWRAVTRLGGYDKVTSCKLWRQVGESFKPPKTCTTVSWTFRGFYEKALLDYERHKTNGGELTVPIVAHTEPMIIENQALASGRARRDAAARAMQGWHSQRLLANGEVSDPIIKDRNSMSLQKREKQLKSISLLKRKKPSYLDNAVKAARSKPSKPQLHTSVIDIGPPADWVKINVQKTKDCFEVYALVPGLLREEVRVQSDPAGRLVISGEPEHPDNPWGVTPFKKIVSLPLRIDPHHTSAVVTLHGQLFVRVPFEQSE